MSNFGTIYKYELRKIAGKKLFVISFILCAVISLSGFYFRYMGNVYIDDVLVGTNAEYHKQDIAYAKALDSRVIDDELLSEMVSAYRKVPYVTDRHYTGTEEYQKYARPYSAIFNFVRQCGGYGTAYLMYEWQPSEADFYVKRGEMLENSWKDLFLSESEKQFWREKEVGIQKPFTFYETTAYDEMFAHQKRQDNALSCQNISRNNRLCGFCTAHLCTDMGYRDNFLRLLGGKCGVPVHLPV